MKSKLMAVIGLLMIMVLLATSQVSAITNVVTPVFEEHEGEELSFNPAFVEFSTDETILGVYSVKMCIPESAIPDNRWGLGLNVETRLATGMSRRQGLTLYNDISFKAYFEEPPPFDPDDPTSHAPLYVSLILYDKTNDVWVSMIPTPLPYVYPGGTGWGSANMGFSDPDGDGWWTATPDSSERWIAWSFAGSVWPGIAANWYEEVMTLSKWDTYIAAHGLDVKVVKVNIQFGYRPPRVYQDWGAGFQWYELGVAHGTVYVDELSFAGRILDFEP